MSTDLRRGAPSVGALALLLACFAATFLPGPWGDERVTDLPLYAAYADLFLDGALPYRDVSFEYPPLAAPLLALPAVAGAGEETYRLAFAGLALLLAAAVVLLTGALAERTGGDRTRALLAAAAAPLVCGAMIRTHFDLAPVALTLGALLLLCVGRPRTGMAVLGVGVATKLFPLVVAPVALAWLIARGQRRAALDGAIAMTLVVLAVYAAAAALSASGTVDSLSYHLDRPVQVESSPAVILRGLDALGIGTAEHVHSHRSDGLTHAGADLAATLFAALFAALLAVLAVGAARRRGGRPPEPRALVLGSLTALAAFAALGKVLSPQFLVWVVPLAALAFAWRLNGLAVAAWAAILLTLAEFPARYDDVVAGDAAAVWLVAARDAALIAAVAMAARSLLAAPTTRPERARGSARSMTRARPGPPRPARR